MPIFHSVLLFLFCLPLVATAAPLQLRDFTLANGLKVIVEEDHSIPSVSLQVFYQVGSRRELSGQTGLAHFFEHMMFRGTKKYPGNQFDTVMEEAGGRNNAYTHRDMTVYLNWIPSALLGRVMELEADRMVNLTLEKDVFEAERLVVAAERRSNVDSDNNSLLYEQLWANAYVAHPYQHPVVGWSFDIDHWTLDQLRQFYHGGYAPNNAVLVVVGDVTTTKVREMVTQTFGRIPKRDIVLNHITPEPDQQGERRFEFIRETQTPSMIVGYHVPETKSKETLALEVLAEVLFTGESSRLYRKLIREAELATEVSGGVVLGADPTLFMMSASAHDITALKKIEVMIDKELQSIAQEGIASEELRKVKNGLLAEFYRGQETLEGKGQLYGLYELYFGDYRRVFSTPDEYEAVTSEQVIEVIEKYLKQDNRTVGILVPESTRAIKSDKSSKES